MDTFNEYSNDELETCGMSKFPILVLPTTYKYLNVIGPTINQRSTIKLLQKG